MGTFTSKEESDTAQRRKQVKEVSEKNRKLIRIRSLRWRPFQKMCTFTLQGMTGLLVAQLIYIFFSTEPWFWRWEGGTVFSASLKAERGYATESWPMKCTCWSPGFLGELFESWLAPFVSWFDPSAFQKGRCDPAGGPFLLQSQGNSGRAKRWKSGDTHPGRLDEKTHSQSVEATVYSGFSLCAAERNLNW